MTNKKKLFCSFVQLAALAVTLALATTSLSWLVNGDRVVGMQYSIAKIDSSVTLYRANDDNKNGVPNMLETPAAANYYLERFDFEKLGAEVYALSEDTELNQLVDVSFDGIYPTEVHTLKYALINRSTIENRVTFKLANASLSAEQARVLSSTSLRLGVVRSDSADSAGDVVFGDKIYLYDCISGTDFSTVTLDFGSGEDVYINGFTGISTTDNCLDFWLQLEFESYGELVRLYPDFPLSEAEYNALEGKSAVLPNLYIYFEIVY